MFFPDRLQTGAVRKEEKALPANKSPEDRVSERTSFHSFLRAGLTVETACVLPLFLWAVMGALCFLELSALQVRLIGGIRDTARKMAVISYGLYGGEGEEESGIGMGEIISGAVSVAYARTEMMKKADLKETVLGSIADISLAASDFSDREILDIKVMSGLRFPLPVFQTKKLRFLERGRVRAWTGRSLADSDSGGGSTEEGEMVYVTETGTVYHRDENCTHIRRSISSVTVSEVEGKRNGSGGKYYPCSCYLSHPADMVYYTKHGDRYHSTLSCSRLKRTVRKIEMSEAEHLRPCTKCGG